MLIETKILNRNMAKPDTTNISKTAVNETMLKYGIASAVGAALSLALIFLTSLDNILFPLTFALMVLSIIFVIASNKCNISPNNTVNWEDEYMRNPLNPDPRNPFRRAKK